MADIRNLKNRRAGHRACATKLIRQAELASTDFNLLKECSNELQRQRQLILNFDEIIQSELDEDSLFNDIEESSNKIREIDSTLSEIKAAFEETTASEVASASVSSKQVKLPYIKLPKFCGNPLDWPHFWDLFTASIHNRTDIGGAAKFHYLVSQLTDEAAELMIGFHHTDAEYDEAVTLLNYTYGKTQRLIEARLHAIFDLKCPKPTASGIRHFRSLFEGHLRGLKMLNANIEDAGYVFSAILIRNLPMKVRDNINRAGKKDTWKLEDLRKAIEEEICHLEATQRTVSDSFSDSFANPKLETGGGTAAFPITLASKVTRSPIKFTVSCHYCQNSHSSSCCSEYKTADERRSQIMMQKLCFNCLRKGHSMSQCTNNARCLKCKNKHHSSICNYKIPQKENKAAANTILSSTNVDGSTILPTAMLKIKHFNHINKYQLIHSLFDTGYLIILVSLCS
jgi:hypothetical protein